MTVHADPTEIFQLGEGFMASKTLLSAIELELFTHLGADGVDGEQIKGRSACTRGPSPTSPTPWSRWGC